MLHPAITARRTAVITHTYAESIGVIQPELWPDVYSQSCLLLQVIQNALPGADILVYHKRKEFVSQQLKKMPDEDYESDNGPFGKD